MKFLKKKTIIAIFLVGILFFVFMVSRVLEVRTAHATFENYYAFRGCSELLQRGEDFGLCKTDTGQTIKIVKFENKWYLDGDLPVCTFGVCL